MHASGSPAFESHAPALTGADPGQLDFGHVALTDRQRALLVAMNTELFALCRSLPAPLRDPALLAVQGHFAGFRLQNLLRFFEKFYAPAWTVLDWIGGDRARVSEGEVRLATRTQAVAMFLHLLDDHLSDGQIAASHVLLQLRTEGWRRYRTGVDALAEVVEGGDALVEGLIDTYFEGILSEASADAGSLRARTCRELGTGLVLPLLLSRRAGIREDLVRSAYESFVVAWRMIDDLRDVAEDARRGERTTVYFALPPELRAAWDAAGAERLAAAPARSVYLPGFVDGIHRELAQAADAATHAGLPGYAAQLRALGVGLPHPTEAS